MKILYLDLNNGVSGDMLLSSLADAGPGLDWLEKELAKIPVDFSLEWKEAIIAGQKTKRINVLEGKSQPHRHVHDIIDVFENSPFSDKVKADAKAILNIIAEAEANAHNEPVDHIHFHEIGAVDTIIDIVGACLLIENIKPDRIIASPINLGSGYVEFSHGRFKVPAPAVEFITQDIPHYLSNAETELATPTGTAIIRHFARFAEKPDGHAEKIGYGSGTLSNDENPTVLKAILIR
jgi:pyridinium-3,5-bisthiocarboxylic acid mononucleotide nickel chelatase